MGILNNTLVINLTSGQAMQKERFWIFNQFKVIYFSLLALIILGFNFILNDALHEKIHHSGQLLVKQVFELEITPSSNNKILAALVKNEGFMLKPNSSLTHFGHIIKLEREVYNYKTLSLNLYHPPVWIIESYLFILLNLVVFGAASWFYRWWNTLHVNNISRSKNLLASTTPSVKEHNTQVVKVLKNFELSSLYTTAPVCHSLFVLVQCNCHFDNNIDKEASFEVLMVKNFSELSGVSVRLLNCGNLAITLSEVPFSELERYVQHLHKSIFLACRNYQKNITRKDIKVGACDYRLRADQTTVYQLAKAALVLSQRSLLKHCHRLPLNQSQTGVLSSKQVIDNIKKHKFILFFQPLFELSSGDILQHEVLLRVRHSKHGLIAARYFIDQTYSRQDTLILDKGVLIQVKKLLLAEPSQLTVSVNLCSDSWINKKFWSWFSVQLNDFKLSSKLQFEISEVEFFNHHEALKDVFIIMKKGGSRIMIDNVKCSENLMKLADHQEVCGLKLSYELVHLVDEKTQNQNQIKTIISISNTLNLPVFAVGVETQKELLMLTKLGVAGAQGFYFSEPLEELTQAVFH